MINDNANRSFIYFCCTIINKYFDTHNIQKLLLTHSPSLTLCRIHKTLNSSTL